MQTSKVTGASGKGFSWLLCGNLTYSLCQWAFVVVLAKTGSPNDVGGYAFGLAISTPFLTFANCQGRNLVASDIDNKYAFREYVGFRAMSLAAAMLAVAFLAIWTGYSLSAAGVTCLLGISLAFDWMSETYFGLLQKHDRLDRVGLSLMLKGPLCLVLLTVAMYATHSLLWAALGLAAGRGLILFLFDARMAANITGPQRPALRRESVSGMLRSALPLGVISAIAAFSMNIPRYFIEADLGTRELGIFSAIASLAGAGNLIMSALANSSFVAIARAVAKGERREYRVLSLRLLGTSAALGLCGVAVAMIAGKYILTKVFRPEYAADTHVFTRLMIAGALSYMITGQGYALTAARVLTSQIPILLCAAVATALFCWWLVPARGIQGAAEAWLLSSVVTLSLSSLILFRVSRDSAATPFEWRTRAASTSEAA